MGERWGSWVGMSGGAWFAPITTAPRVFREREPTIQDMAMRLAAIEKMLSAGDGAQTLMSR